jgi:acetoin utilization protein AcuB
MRLQDFMSTEIKTISPTATVGTARNVMRTHGIHHLLVVDMGRVVGVVSYGDLGGRAGVRGVQNEARALSEIMTGHVVTAVPETTVRQAANLLRGRTIGCLVVLDGGAKPVGIVTTTDLLELLGRGAERPIERSTPWTLGRRGVRRATASARHGRSG